MKPQTNQNSTVRLSVASAPSPVIATHQAIRESRWLSGGMGLLLLLFTTLSFSQTWQWGKSGGSGNNPSGEANSTETVKAMATDGQGNIFMIADVGADFLKVDGNVKTHYGANADESNGVLASFTCNGTYRWSKVIGGQYNSYINDVKTDATGNVYVVGRISYVGVNPPNTFDGEFNVPLAVSLPGNMISNKINTYFAKYSNTGVLQWVKFPENTILPSDGFGGTCELRKIEIDMQGNFYILALLYGNGTYFNGAYTNTFGSSTHILKYDPQGNFLNGTRLDKSNNYGTFSKLKFKRNHSTGEFYVSNFISFGDIGLLNLGGIPFTKKVFVAKFSPTGAFIWKAENTDINSGSFPAIDLDSDGSLFFQSMAIGGFNTLITDTFAGMSFPSDLALQPRSTYVVKLNPNGQAVWSNNSRKEAATNSGLKINGNEIAVPMTMSNIKWGHEELFEPSQNVYDAGIARLNKNTGEFITMSKIPSFPNTRNSGTSITSDALGNYYVGGNFSSVLLPGAGQLNTTGGNNDFFVAKYGTSNCNCQLPTCSFRALNTAANLNVFNFRYYGQEVYTSVSWNFGDGTPLSTQVNPTHTFAQPGVYNVCLTATNACGTQTFCSYVNTSVLGIKDQKLEVANLMTLAPNPASTFCRIDYEVQTPNAFITIYDLNGRLIEQQNIKDDLKGSWKINVSSYPVGVYLVTVQIPGGALLQRKLNVVR